MNEEFDDRLKNRIADIFDNYEDDSAGKGWALLREKYPEEKKRRGIIWLWWGSAAAVLFVILGLGIWLNKDTIIKPALVHQNVKNDRNTIAVNPSASGKHVPVNNSASNQSNQSQIAITKQATTADRLTVNKTRSGKSSSIDQYLANTSIRSRKYKTNAHIPSGIEKNNTVVEQTNQTIAVNGSKQTSQKPVEAKMIDTALAANQPKAKPADVTKPPVFTALKPNGVKTNKPVDQAVKFSVYAATYINYSKGSDNQFNVGAGFSSDIRIVGNLKLSTGILIAQNSFDYKTTVPQTANNYIAASIANSNRNLAAADPIPSTSAYLSIVPTSKASNPVIRDYQASLLALDIPLNLKYQFAKSDTYISAGVSSGTYLAETYNFAYNYTSSYLTNTDQQNSQTKTSFNTFDFARTLNLSFGTGYRLSKNNRLIIEPFLKYPLGGLGSQNIKFGAGGLNLKLNFQTVKK